MSNEKMCPICKMEIKEAAKVCKQCKAKLVKCGSCDEWTDASNNTCMICESELSIPGQKIKKPTSGPSYWRYLIFAIILSPINTIIHYGVLEPESFYNRYGVSYHYDPMMEDLFVTQQMMASFLYPLLILLWGITARNVSSETGPYKVLKQHLIGSVPVIIISFLWREGVTIDLSYFLALAIGCSLLLAFPKKLYIGILIAVFTTMISNIALFLVFVSSSFKIAFYLSLLDWRAFFLFLPTILLYQQVVKPFSSDKIPLHHLPKMFFKNEIHIEYHPKEKSA